MRVPDQLLKAVAFVSRDELNLQFRASAFVVSIPHDEQYGMLHVVTAKHVALSPANGEGIVGMNGKDGSPIWMRNSTEVPWFFHPDPSVDIAILPMATAIPKEYDYQDISTTRFVSAERLAAYNIGVGDETFTVGLFAPYVGHTRLVPQVRSGIISVIASGRVPHPVFGSMEAHLIEGRSIGGLSGSPVFVRNTINIQVADITGENSRVVSALGEFHLLGMLSGHWNTIQTNPSDGRDINTGISLVVPAQKILEALFSPELTTLREIALARGLIPGR